ncbi:44421_t:CDS:2 [Gigaspora margarita]|uniref:44421_t:CDS:1 n=1 Tax=Gigaspora margarita TaxID=4874 RepID=A0ABM8VVF3_GIGMA|nr:44421_t:CDS:2 [Gigaspora margarita]
MVGQYVFQKVPISCSESDYILAPEDLFDSSLLLIYTASIVPNSYIPNNRGGRESFIIARHLYNGHLKLRPKRLPHILASDIEWAYLSDDSQPLTAFSAAKVVSQEEIDTHLNSIEEKYATLTS